jgi:hypothetical protein
MSDTTPCPNIHKLYRYHLALKYIKYLFKISGLGYEGTYASKDRTGILDGEDG